MATSSDWQCDKSLTECLEHMLKSKIATDVTFLVGEKRKNVNAHKFILMSRSPVFYAMFEGLLPEKGDIRIPDIDEDTFYLFLGYLYTDQANLDVHNVIGVLAAARKYCVDKLVAKCQTFIKKNLNLKFAGVLLEEAHFFMELETKDSCLKLIWEKPKDFLQSEHFGHLCSDCVKSITDSDDLAVNEKHVYEAVLKWSEEECARKGLEVNDKNRRKVLGDILYTVRFPLLNKDFFVDVVSTTDLLTSDEIASVLRLRSGKGIILSSKIKKNKRKSPKIDIIPIKQPSNYDSLLWNRPFHLSCGTDGRACSHLLPGGKSSGVEDLTSKFYLSRPAKKKREK